MSLGHDNALVRMLHSTPRLHGSSTPEEIVGDPVGYTENTALMPGVMLGMAVLTFVALLVYGLYRSECKCCCPRDRHRKNRQTTTRWKQVLSVLLFFLVGAACLQYAYTTRLSSDARGLVGKAIDAKAYLDEIVAKARVLDTLGKHDLFLLDQILQANFTSFGNTTIVSDLTEARKSAAAATNASTEVIREIDKQYDIQTGVDRASSYLVQGECYGYEASSAIWFLVVVGLITLLPMDRCPATSIRVVVVFLALGLILGQVLFGVAVYTLTIVLADGCINPTAFISALANDSVIDYYLNCVDPLKGGPVNANFDAFLVDLDIITAPLRALEQATLSNAPVLHGLVVDLQNNVTATIAVVNDTRILMSCTRIHDLLQDATRRLCSPSDILGDLFVLSWSHYMGALLALAVFVWIWNPLHVATHDLVPLVPPAVGSHYTDSDSGGQNYPYPA